MVLQATVASSPGGDDVAPPLSVKAFVILREAGLPRLSFADYALLLGSADLGLSTGLGG